MRYLLAVLLAAPTAAVAQDLSLSVEGVTPGEDMVISVAGASAGQKVRLARSVALSPSPVHLGGGIFTDLARARYHGTQIASPAGEASWTELVPGDGQICWQAFAHDAGDLSTLTWSAPTCVHTGADDDGDGVINPLDVCPGFDDRLDDDEDGQPNDCDPCPADPDDADEDADGICDIFDDCIGDPGFPDSDADGICDPEDLCPDDPLDECAGFVIAEGRNGLGNGFYQIDLATGTAVLLGSNISFTGLAYDASGRLWGIEAQGCSGTANFYSVNPLTGEGVLEHAVTNSYAWSGLTAVGDTLYHWAECSPAGGDSLFEFDPVSGDDTRIYGSGSAGHCIAADADGTMYRISSSTIYEVDEIAGTEISLGSISGMGGVSRGSGCSFHEGSLYYVAGDGSASTLYAIDIPTLTASDTGVSLPTASFDALASPTP
ncbi:MAG: hypothetical protein ACI8PZ_003037 [Myxococcota bacterium]|jgi:hypothetical protein